MYDFSDNMYYLNTDFSHIISVLHPFSEQVSPFKQRIDLKFYGVDDGSRFRVGLCLPKEAEIEVNRFVRQQPVEEFEDLEEDFDNSKFFHDKDIGVLFFMVTGNKDSQVQVGGSSF